ncbi:MAG: MBL fold metallo-hydrolase, partial [Actinobacteria bacterium]|nr:MBL fold metallo-hydrolase [Actinomycetota bacterium]
RNASDHGIAYDPATRSFVIEGSGAAQPTDLTCAGGETLRPARDWVLEIHLTPGLTHGHLSVYDTKQRILFASDALQGAQCFGIDGTPNLCPVFVAADVYQMTLRAVAGLRPAILCSAHWLVILGTGHAVRGSGHAPTWRAGYHRCRLQATATPSPVG